MKARSSWTFPRLLASYQVLGVWVKSPLSMQSLICVWMQLSHVVILEFAWEVSLYVCSSRVVDNHSYNLSHQQKFWWWYIPAYWPWGGSYEDELEVVFGKNIERHYQWTWIIFVLKMLQFIIIASLNWLCLITKVNNLYF